MVRWIAFDDDTAEAVVNKFMRGAAEIREGETPLSAALALDRPSVMILPSSMPGKVLLATFEPKTAAAQETGAEVSAPRDLPVPPFGGSPSRYQATPQRPAMRGSSGKWWHRKSA